MDIALGLNAYYKLQLLECDTNKKYVLHYEQIRWNSIWINVEIRLSLGNVLEEIRLDGLD